MISDLRLPKRLTRAYADFVEAPWPIRGGVLVLLPLALASLGRGMQNALGWTETSRSLDLVSYWLGGRLLLEGVDPYQAALAGTLWQNLPASIESLRPGFDAVPANAPLQMLLLAPLAAFPWEAMRFIFASVNLLTALALPFLLSRSWSNGSEWPKSALLAVFFWSLVPTRNVIANGQTTLLVLAAALLAVRFSKKRPVIAGLALALAWAKYSLTLPLAVWFLFAGLALPLLVALAVHLLAFPVLALINGQPVLSTAGGYVAMLRSTSGFQGETDILSVAARLGWPNLIGWGVLLAVSLMTGILLVRVWRARRAGNSGVDLRKLSPLILSFLFSFALLSVYHRMYDAAVLIVLLAAIWSLPVADPSAHLGLGGQRVWNWAPLIVLGVFLLPRESFSRIWVGWEPSLIVAGAAATLAAWALSGMALLQFGSRERET